MPTPKRRRKHRKPRKPFDGRKKICRRVKQLTLTFRERLAVGDDPDPLLLARIDRAAQLQALAEQLSARALREDPAVTSDDLVRLTRWADLAMRRLDIIGKRKEPAQMGVTAYLAQRGSQP
jgi:hypothetical protein